jgi:hypothetical protein
MTWLGVCELKLKYNVSRVSALRHHENISKQNSGIIVSRAP